MSCRLSDFQGQWMVDTSRSQSIEPLLVTFGFDAKVRKDALAVKFVQTIAVKDENVVTINNISKHGAQQDVYDLNDKNCSCVWNPFKEYPLSIRTVLPERKCVTVDCRKMADDHSSFQQRLVLKRKGAEDVVIYRTFVPLSTSTQQTVANLSNLVVAVACAVAITAAYFTRDATGWETSTAAMTAFIATYGIARAHDVFPQLKKNQREKGPIIIWIATVLGAMVCTMAFATLESTGDMKRSIPVLLSGLILLCLARYFSPNVTSDKPLYSNFLLAQTVNDLRLMFVVSGAGFLLCLRWYINEQDRIHRSLGFLMYTVAFLAVLVLRSSITEPVVAEPAAMERRKPKRTPKKLSHADEKLRRALMYHKSVFDIHVTRYRVVDNDHADYKIKVQFNGAEWFVWRRFSEFDALRKDIRPMFASGVLPQLPPKSLVHNLDPRYLEERRRRLDMFLRNFFQFNLLNELLVMTHVKDFLGIKGTQLTLDVLNDPDANDEPICDEKVVERFQEAIKLVEHAASMKEGDGWKLHSTQKGVECFLKKEGDFTFTKGIGRICAPVGVTLAFLADKSNRRKYDDLIKKETLLATLDPVRMSEALNANVEHGSINWSEFKSPFPMAIAARDVVTASIRIRDKDSGRVSVYLCSVDGFHPPDKKYVRAHLFATGMIFTPNEDSSCTLTNVQMLDPNGSIPAFVINTVAPENCMFSAKIDALLKDKATWPASMYIEEEA